MGLLNRRAPLIEVESEVSVGSPPRVEQRLAADCGKRLGEAFAPGLVCGYVDLKCAEIADGARNPRPVQSSLQHGKRYGEERSQDGNDHQHLDHRETDESKTPDPTLAVSAYRDSAPASSKCQSGHKPFYPNGLSPRLT